MHGVLLRGKNALVNPTAIMMITAIGMWVMTFFLFGSRYPYNYDSINYALAIADDFNIGTCQPHAYGYIFHILVCRLWLPFVRNPFIIQQLQNICYLCAALCCMVSMKRYRRFFPLIAATAPLSLFFSSTSVIHAASFTASAALAWMILRLEDKKLHPLILACTYAAGIGFRQDLAIFMGPVVLYALLRARLSFVMWLAVFGSGIVITAVWYVGTSWSSGWLSPWVEAHAIVRPFLQATSLVYGAPVKESLRVIVRMFLYIPAVLGPGGIVLLVVASRTWNGFDWRYIAAAVVPFFLYGILFYVGIPNYYASITGFVFTWTAHRWRKFGNRFFVAFCVVANILWFLILPAPLTNDYGTWSSRPMLRSVLKQLSYFGSTGRAIVLKNRTFDTFLDEGTGDCASFTVADSISFNGIPYWRAWKMIGKRVWNIPYTSDNDSAECCIEYIRPGRHYVSQCAGVGVARICR